jgi:hypothetical protein
MARSLLCLAVLCGTILSLTTVASGDIPGPGRRPFRPRVEPQPEPQANPATTTSFSVSVDASNRQVSHLEIPQKLLHQHNPGMNKTGEWQPRLRTIFAGLAMSLAVAGVFVVRRNKAGRLTLMTVVAASAILASMGLAFADLLPPGRRIPLPPPAENDSDDVAKIAIPANLNVKIHVVPQGDQVVLVLSKKDAARAGLIVQSGNAPATAPAPPPAR